MRKVKFVRFHSSVNVHGFGEIGTTLPASNKVLRNLDLRETPTGAVQVTAVCDTKGHPQYNKPISFIVGAASVLVYVLGDDEALTALEMAK